MSLVTRRHYRNCQSKASCRCSVSCIFRQEGEPEWLPGITEAPFTSRGRILCDDFNYRDHVGDPLGDTEVGTALAALDDLPQLTRVLMESNDIFVQLDDKYQIRKVIKRRHPELMQGFDSGEPSEDPPEVDPEDALAPGRAVQLSAVALQNTTENENESDEEVSTTRTDSRWVAPKEKFDLIFEDTRDQTGNIINQFSAPVFPLPRDKRPYGLQAKLIKTVMTGIVSGAWLFEQCQSLRPSERKRVWEVLKIERFLRERKATQCPTIEPPPLEEPEGLETVVILEETL